MRTAPRLVALVALVLGSVLGPALVGAVPQVAADDWVCVGLKASGRGFCLGDPLPESLPVP